ncbi:heme exporter protein CcmB [Parvularcula sp. LCG005]|uniref:heme exporter protein CcmB n=1 Tax=Parvularcula sp. LCG005 TaxID=3078805 RepID=UPI002941CC89|nr:heme exporter protein CcmB [Parvularcula sp. LCG005]WOI53406.1 heme exporter protein CcmB [Parvularcula sp. LCG005]
MRQQLAAILWRELRLRLRGGGWAAAAGLFAVTAGLAPLSLGRDPELLATAAPAVLWLAASLSLLIGFDALYEEDLKSGGMALYRLSPVPLPLTLLLKTLAAWIVTCLPLAILAPVLLAAFGVERPMMGGLGFVLGTPGLALIASSVGALCAGLRRGTALFVFLALPLFIPALVFGPQATSETALGPLLFLAAFSLQAIAICPFVAAAAIRTNMS